MRKTLTIFYVSLLTLGALMALTPKNADAIPTFARQVGKDCTLCHSAFPKLTETGRIFRANGFRFAEDGEWKEAKDIPSIPLSMEVEVEGMINNDEDKNGETKRQESDILVEELAFFAGTPIGKTGKLSAFGSATVGQSRRGEYDISTGTAFVQFNDLIGGVGNGMLNVRAGQWDLSLPFLARNESPIKNRYIAQKKLGILGGEGDDQINRAIELNGQIVGEEGAPTHRYAIGVARTEVDESKEGSDREMANTKNKLANYFATYSVNLMEHYNLGAIYKNEKVKHGISEDATLNKYGIAGEAEFGPVFVTAGYFAAESEDDKDYSNIMAELLYLPNKQIVLGARYDVLSKEDKDDATATTLTARYNILSNVYGMAEYRLLDDTDNIYSSSNDEEKRVRVFLVALF